MFYELFLRLHRESHRSNCSVYTGTEKKRRDRRKGNVNLAVPASSPFIHYPDTCLDSQLGISQSSSEAVLYQFALNLLCIMFILLWYLYTSNSICYLSFKIPSKPLVALWHLLVFSSTFQIFFLFLTSSLLLQHITTIHNRYHQCLLRKSVLC